MDHFQAEVFGLHLPRKLHNLTSGVGPFSFFRTTPATIYIIATTGAMLSIGQERSRENAALAAEPGCNGDSKLGKV